jgi:hypothetical protein
MLAGAIVLCGLHGCGGSTPSSPPPTTTTTSVLPTPTVWTLNGQVVATIGRQPVAGATVEMSTATARTDNDGRFTLTDATAPTRAFAVTVRAAGYRTRETTIAYPRTAEPVIDLTAAAAPFSEEFYGQIARNAYERPESRTQLFRWSVAPRLYLRTTDETGRPAPPEVVALVTGALADAVRLFSAGTFTLSLEQGTERRPEQPGWINVEIKQTIPEGDFCGYASDVGGNPSTVQLRLERCGCGSIKIPQSIVLHEVGHVLGFFHVPDRNSVMYPFVPGECREIAPSPAEQHHVAVAYARPRGNLDPDRDPSSFALLTPPAAAVVRRPMP